MYRLQRIDELLLPSHQYLTETDECDFFMNYTRLGLGFTKENDLMMNFKKEMNRRGNQAEWKYKGIAIKQVSNMFLENIPNPAQADTIFVPIPPSKIKTDTLYDNRMIQVLNNFCNERNNVEMREIISISENMVPTHVLKQSPNDILPHLHADPAMCEDQKPNIVLVDDVITEGAHFKACQSLLQPFFPNTVIRGLFIARTDH